MKQSKLLILSVLVTVFAGIYTAHAEPVKADSLRKQLLSYTKADTQKVNLYLALAEQYTQVNADTMFHLGKQALELSQKLNYHKGIANATERIGIGYSLLSKNDSALYWYNIAIKETKANDLTNILSSKYGQIANVYFVQAHYAIAKEYYDSSLNAAQAAGQEEQQGKMLSNIANVFYMMGNYSQALDYYLKGLKIQERLGRDINLAADVSNIANVYFRLGQHDKAIEYVNRGFEINKRLGAKEHMIGCITTYALIYNDEKQYDSSLYYLNKGLAIAYELNNTYIINLLKGNIAECYVNKGEYAKALPLYQESLVVSQKLDDAEGVSIAKAGIGLIYLKTGKKQEGIKYQSEALDIVKQLGIKEQVEIISKTLSEEYEKVGDYKNALYYSRIADAYADSLNKENSHREIAQKLFDYEIQKKEDKIQLLEKDNAIKQTRSQIQNILLLASVIGMLLAIAVAYLFFKNVKNVKKSRLMILKQKEEIEEQAHKLSELNDFKDNTFSVLAHDLRSPVNALTSTMMLLDEKIITPEEFSEYKLELNNKLQSVSLLLDNMLQWAQSQMKGEHTLDIEKLNLRRKVLKTMAVLKDPAGHKGVTIKNEVPENVWAYGDRNHIDIVVRNLVSNAIKFTPANGEIVANAYEENGVVYLSISDNGVGMTQDQVDKLFAADTHVTTKGTSGEKGTGLGLHLCYDLVKKNKGDIVVSSAPGVGSTFIVSLPARK